MKRYLTGIGTGILALLLVVGLIGCGQKTPEGAPAAATSGGKSVKTVDFESIELTETGTMAFKTVYSCKRTENGVHVEYYIFRDGVDEETNEPLNEKRMIHSFDGDEKVYQGITKILGTVPISSWDGYSKTNSLVSDGSSFSLNVELSDGSKVTANGTNAYPEGYREFVNRLDAACATELVKNTSFETEDYSFSVPKSWVGNVYAVYRDGMIGFEVKTKKKFRMILCFYQSSYNSAGNVSDYVSLVSFLKGEETWFVKMRRMADSYSALEEMNSKQKAICNSLDEDMKTIKSSFKLKGNYEIVDDPVQEEGEQSYVSGYYQDPNSNNGDGQEDSDKKEGEDAEGNGEENEENNNDSEENGGEEEGNGGAEEGNGGGADEGNEGGAEDGGTDEGGADEGTGEGEGGADEGTNDG